MPNKAILSERNLTIVNFIIVAYFIAIWLIYTYQIDLVIIGVIAELFTIPYLLGQFVFAFLSIMYVKKHKTKTLFKISTVALVICCLITTASFF